MGNLKMKNTSLIMAEWLWRFSQEKEALWYKKVCKFGLPKLGGTETVELAARGSGRKRMLGPQRIPNSTFPNFSPS